MNNTPIRGGASPIHPATTYPAIVGRVLLRRREAMGLTQVALANAAGVSQSTWSKIETGTSALSLAQLRQSAVLLHTTPGALLAEADAAADSLVERGVIVYPDRGFDSGDMAAAVMTGAALGALLVVLLKK